MGATLKRIIALTLAVALATTLTPAAAFASDGEGQGRYGAAVAATALDETPTSADAPVENLGLDVSYGKDIRCGQSVDFSLTVSNPKTPQADEKIEYLYHLDWVRIDFFDGYSTNVTSANKIPPYQSSNRIEFSFFANNTYTLRFSAMEKTFKLKAGSAETKPEYVIDSVRVASKQVDIEVRDPAGESLSSAIEKIASECRAAGCVTDFQKALWLHDWLVEHCAYDYSAMYSHAEGALLRGTATCNGYHHAYRLLLAAVGVRSDSIESTADNHIWTAVEMDGRWYHVDVTKDDIDYDPLPGYPDERHIFFGMSDEAMGNMQGHRDFKSPHPCTSLENNYFLKTGAIAEFSDPYIPLVQQRLAQGVRSFEITALNASMAQPTIQHRINRLIAASLQGRVWRVDGTDYSLKVSYDDVKASPVFSFSVVTVSGDASSEPPAVAVPKKTSLSKARILGLVSKAYTGKRITQKPMVKLGTKTLKLNRDYTLSFKNNLKRGKATVTVKGKGSYTGAKSASFRIMKYKQPMKCSLKAKVKTVKAAKVSKAPVSLPKPFTVKKAKGKVSFSNISTQKGAKPFKVNSRTGTVTIPKTTKKGTYLLKVKIQAVGSSPYAYGSRNLILKVHIR